MQDITTSTLNTQDYLRSVAAALASCEHGRKGPIIAAAQAWLGVKSAQAVYDRLATVGYDSGRKRRVDAGTVELPRAEAEQIAAMIQSTMRGENKRMLSVADIVDVLRVEGKIDARRIDGETGEMTDLSTSAILRALRVYGLHHKQLAAATPHVQLASRHPNHVWEMDFSVCVLFYLRGDTGLRVMRERDYNKNKPANVAKVEKDRVLRGVIVDHTTHLTWLFYALGGEQVSTAIDMLIRAFVGREGVPYRGVPLVLYTDQGPAFKSGTFDNFMRRCMIEHLRHEPGNSRATGSVEVAHNIVERSFEGRLGIGYRVQTLDELQALADRWTKWHNTTHKHSRHGMTRADAWLRITESQLRRAPSEDVLRSLAHTHPVTRTVAGNLTISFARKNTGSLDYCLRDVPGLEGIRVGEKVAVVLNPYHAAGILVVRESADGKSELHIPLEPINANEWGYRDGAPIIGESYASFAETDAERASKRLQAIAMGTDTAEQAQDARKGGAIPFAGIDPHKPLETPDVAYLPQRGTDLAPTAPLYVAPVITLNIAEAALLLRDRIGSDAWTADHYHALARLYPQGVPETELDTALERITGRTRLRVVAGGGAAP